MVSASDGSAFTGSVTVAVTIDAGTQATGTVGSGACTHEGNGYHTYAPSQAETNGNLLAFTFTGTGAIPATVQVFTVSYDPHDTVRLGLTALPNAAADAAGGLPISDAGGLDLDTMNSNVSAVLADTGTDGVLLAATATSAQLVDDVWDEALTGATHNVATSAGKRLRELAASVIRDGTAQAGAANSITLDAGASATNEIYDENLVTIVAGTGAGQTRRIAEYNGTSKVAIVDRVWETNPASDSEFVILADAAEVSSQHGLAQGGTASTITLSADASATDDIYNGSVVVIRTSVGAGQARLITDYNGTTKVATVKPDWVTNPTSASVYRILPIGRADVELIEGLDASDQIRDAVVDDATRIDASALNTASGAVGSNGSGLTEAGGTGDHLTAINLPDQTMNITGNITGNLSGSVGSLTTNNDKTGYSLANDARPTKNVALSNFCFLMVDATDFATPETGLTITAQISKDGGAFAAATNAAAEIANGWYAITLTQAEMNADTVLLRFTATGAAARNVQILTQPAL